MLLKSRWWMRRAASCILNTQATPCLRASGGLPDLPEESAVVGCGCGMEARNEEERKTLRVVLAINAGMFVFEVVLGWLAQSTGLIADSLDMFADASVYAISLYAVGKSAALQAGSARLSGFAQILLALLVLADVIGKLLYGSEPV